MPDTHFIFKGVPALTCGYFHWRSLNGGSESFVFDSGLRQTLLLRLELPSLGSDAEIFQHGGTGS